MASSMHLLGFVTVLMLVFHAETTPVEICEQRHQFSFSLPSSTLGKITKEDGSIGVRGFKYRPGTF
jgi:hypothetical protein